MRADLRDRFIELVSEQEYSSMLDFMDDLALRHMIRWLKAEQTRNENCDSKWFAGTLADLEQEAKRRNDEAKIEANKE